MIDFKREYSEKAIYVYISFTILIFGLHTQLFALGTEDFGPSQLSPANYTEWDGILPLIETPGRVYHTWVNGDEYFYYSGDTAVLNQALKKFAEVDIERRELILRPGPGIARPFDKKKEDIPYDWSLHIIGGIAMHQAKDPDIWDMHPTMTVYIGDGNIRLDKIEIPEGITVLSLFDLRTRYLNGMQDKDPEVRSYAAMFLAEKDPYNRDNLNEIAKLLESNNSWVRTAAANALSSYGKLARPVVHLLKKAERNEDETPYMKNIYRKAIKTIETVDPPNVDIARNMQLQEQINIFIQIMTDKYIEE